LHSLKASATIHNTMSTTVAKRTIKTAGLCVLILFYYLGIAFLNLQRHFTHHQNHAKHSHTIWCMVTSQVEAHHDDVQDHDRLPIEQQTSHLAIFQFLALLKIPVSIAIIVWYFLEPFLEVSLTLIPLLLYSKRSRAPPHQALAQFS
jgi:hypothetical protein